MLERRETKGTTRGGGRKPVYRFRNRAATNSRSAGVFRRFGSIPFGPFNFYNCVMLKEKTEKSPILRAFGV